MQGLENPTKKARTEMAAMGLDSIKVAEEMKVSLPGALQMIYDAAKKAGPEGSVPFNRAIADMIGGVKGFTTFAALSGPHMQDFAKNAKLIGDAMGVSTTQVTGWTIAQSNLNIKLDQGRAMLEVLGQNVGEVLLPYVSQLLGMVTPLIAQFGQWATATDGLAGYINQLAAFVTYLYQDVQANGAIKEFGAILSDIGSTVNNTVNTGLSLLGTIFGTTASQAGKASDAATNVADGFKRVLDVVKPLTDAASWLSQQFADSGAKGQILRGVLLTIGGAIAGIKIAEFAGTLATALGNAGLDVQYFSAKLLGMQYAADIDAMSLTKVGVAAQTAGTSAAAARGWFTQLEISLDGTAVASAASGTAFGGMGASAAALGTALGPLIGIATGVRLALSAIPSTQPALWRDMGAQIDQTTMGPGGWVHIVQQGSSLSAQAMQQARDAMTKAAQQTQTNISVAMNTMASNSLAAVWDVVGKASQSFGQLASQVNLDMQNIDASAKWYWLQVANYIEGNPIVGSISYSTGGSATLHHAASGTNYATGGPYIVGERGPELMFVPQGAQIIPHNQSIARSLAGGAGNGQPVQVNINIAGHNLARVLLPELVTAIRNHTAAKF